MHKRKILLQIYHRIKKAFRFSLTFKITVVYTLLFSFLLLLSSLFIAGGFTTLLAFQTHESLTKNQKLLCDYILHNETISIQFLDDTAKYERIYVAIYDAEKKIIYRSDQGKLSILSSPPQDRFQWIQVLKKPGLISKQYVEKVQGRYEVVLIKPLETELYYLLALVIILIISYAAAITLSAVIGSKASQKMLSPIAEMTLTAKNISVQHLDKRLNVSFSQDELKELAETFNDVLDRIQKAYEQQKQFVSDASHELRTPIAVIQGYADMLCRWGKDNPEVLEESVHSIQSEANHMKDLVEKLLFLARGDNSTHTVSKTLFCISDMLQDLVRETELIDHQHQIVSHTQPHLMAVADEKLIKQALRIFIDNAIKYTPAGSSITLNAVKGSQEILLTISDSGVGIPEEDLPHIFTRFYRVDKSRNKSSGGTGLGLAIAKWILDQHHATIHVKSVQGLGTTFSISLPLE